MWNRSNWCERVIFISLGAVLFLLVFNILIQNAVFNMWLFLYVVSIIVLSIWVTCRDIQFLLEQNIPLKSDSNDILAKHSKVNFICIVIPILKKVLPVKDIQKDKKEIELRRRKAIDISSCSDISTIASVIEGKFVWAWYSQYVSKEIAFPFSCKELLDQMVTKIFQVSTNIDTVSLCSDSLGVILRHCKEYKRASKRMERNGKGKLEEYYRNSHPTSSQRNSHTISTKGKSTQSHCLLLIRAFLKELIPWELWGTPHSLLLSSILAKRLDLFIATDLSNPNWLKDKLSKILEPSESKQPTDIIKAPETPSKIVKEKEFHIKVESAPLLNKSLTPVIDSKEFHVKHETAPVKSVEETVIKTSIESALSNMISNSTAPILQRAELEKTTSKSLLHNVVPSSLEVSQKTGAMSIMKKQTQPIDIKSSPSHSFNGQEHSHSADKMKSSSIEVKIYDKVVDGSVKTWKSDVDLECVSLGQDLLASLDGEMGFESRLGRLWEADGADSSEAWSPNPPSTGSSTKTPYGLWFGEEDTLDMDLTEESPPKNMDEAAGMMEGILDFGMAGFRKGLRLTGLQETLQDKANTQKHSSDGNTGNLASTVGQVLTSSRKNSQSDESSIKSDIQKALLGAGKDSDSSDMSKHQQQPTHLVKQHRIISQDSSVYPTGYSKDKDHSKEQLEHPIPVVAEPIIMGTDSPDYEYEEAADFASTIAKLRSLLQQKTEDVTPISQDDGALLHSYHDHKLSMLSKPASATQPNNSPVHKPTAHQRIPEKAQKLDEIASIPSFESENGFTILSQNSADLFEAEEALNHKVGSVTNIANTQVNGNNMQRLDKLFTRTVTGVFNTIKTAVGGDSLADAVSGHTETSGSHLDKQTVVRAHQHKDDWIFVEGNVDVSILVSKLLMERRGFCVVEVEAAQDSLEVLGVANTSSQTVTSQSNMTSSAVQDDLDESDVISGCPLYHMCMELVSAVLGGVMQKDAVIKCTSVAVADMVEELLRENLKVFNFWLRDVIINNFRELSKHPENNSTKVDPSEILRDINVQELSDALFQKIPDIIFTLFGREEIASAVKMLTSSMENPLINRDVIFNLIDVAMLHFLKACLQPTYMTTPPPSA